MFCDNEVIEVVCLLKNERRKSCALHQKKKQMLHPSLATQRKKKKFNSEAHTHLHQQLGLCLNKTSQTPHSSSMKSNEEGRGSCEKQKKREKG